MRSVLRRAVAAAALVAVSAGVSQAQGLGLGGIKVEEIRLDFVGLTSFDGGSTFGVNFPNTVGVGMYLNDKIAIEPMIGLNMLSPDVGDAVTTISIGALVPYYIAGDRGVSGLFVAPGAWMSKTTDVDASTTVGVDIGYKKKWQDKISWRLSAGMRTNDGNSTIVANAGVSIFVR